MTKTLINKQQPSWYTNLAFVRFKKIGVKLLQSVLNLGLLLLQSRQRHRAQPLNGVQDTLLASPHSNCHHAHYIHQGGYFLVLVFNR